MPEPGRPTRRTAHADLPRKPPRSRASAQARKRGRCNKARRTSASSGANRRQTHKRHTSCLDQVGSNRWTTKRITAPSPCCPSPSSRKSATPDRMLSTPPSRSSTALVHVQATNMAIAGRMTTAQRCLQWLEGVLGVDGTSPFHPGHDCTCQRLRSIACGPKAGRYLATIPAPLWNAPAWTSSDAVRE